MESEEIKEIRVSLITLVIPAQAQLNSESKRILVNDYIVKPKDFSSISVCFASAWMII